MPASISLLSPLEVSSTGMLKYIYSHIFNFNIDATQDEALINNTTSNKGIVNMVYNFVCALLKIRPVENSTGLDSDQSSKFLSYCLFLCFTDLSNATSELSVQQEEQPIPAPAEKKKRVCTCMCWMDNWIDL